MCPETYFQPIENSACQRASMFLVEGFVLFSFFPLFFFFLSIEAWNQRNLVWALVSFVRILCHHIELSDKLFSSFHLFLHAHSHLLIRGEPTLSSPNSIILHSTLRKINQITTRWVGSSCLLLGSHLTPRHSTINYLFGLSSDVCVPNFLPMLLSFPQCPKPCIPPPHPQEMNSHLPYPMI